MDKTESPTFLREVDVTVIRQSGSNLFIKQHYLFPHTTGKDVSLSISKIDDVQTIEDIRVFRDGEKIEFKNDPSDKRDEHTVVFGTEESGTPVPMAISHIPSGGVIKFTDTCGHDGEADDTKNVIRWVSGEWVSKSLDMLRVNITTQSDNGKLVPLFGVKTTTGTTEKQIIIKKKSVEAETIVDIYVSESGEILCPNELECFKGGSGLGPDIYL